jgi:hypothetical protein
MRHCWNRTIPDVEMASGKSMRDEETERVDAVEPENSDRVTGRRPSRRRGWVVPVVVVVMVLTAGCTWWVAGRIQSPAQVEANASPPAAGPITAKVREGGLESSFTSRVRFGAARTTEIPLAVDPSGVVTGTPVVKGDRLAFGAPVLEVNGRPVFLVVGDFPFYRDITAGAKGTDVAQWQSYLRSVGFTIPSSEDQVAGPATVRATARFYTNRHYLPPDQTADGTDQTGDTGDPGTDTDASASGEATGDGATEKKDQKGQKVGDGQGGKDSSGVPAGTVILPADEFLVQREAGQRVVKVPKVGDRVGAGQDSTDEGDDAGVGVGITVSEGDLSASTTIPAAQTVGLKKGMDVVVTPDKGKAVKGHLGKIPDPGKAGQDGQVPDSKIPVVLDDPIPASWNGKDFLIEIIQEHVSDDALVVPSRAIAASGSAASIYVQQADGSFTQVQVTELGSADGETAIDPASDAGVKAGSLVRLG